MPGSALHRRIEAVYVVLSLWVCFAATYEAAFYAGGTQFLLANCVVELIFWAQIAIRLRTAVVSPEGGIDTDRRRIRARYLASGELWLDAVALVPVDIIQLVAGLGHWRLARALSLFRLLRLLRYRMVLRYFSARALELKTDMVRLRCARFLITIALLSHATGCAWFFIACPRDRCRAASWVGHADAGSTALDYVNSVYWAVATMTTTGFGDLRAHTDEERIFATLVMLSGKLLYGIILGNIASTLANADYLRVRYKAQIAKVERIFSDRGIPQELRRRALRYFDHMWQVQRGLDATALFANMPYTLKADISWNISQDLIRQVPMFQRGNSGFVAMLALALKPQYFLRGDWVQQEGDVCREIHFVATGYVEVLSRSGAVVQVKHPNSYFGDAEAPDGQPHTASYRAACDVETFVLSVKDLNRTFDLFPEMRPNPASRRP